MTISLPFIPTTEWNHRPAAVLLLKNSQTKISFAIILEARQPRLLSLSANLGNFGSMHIDHYFVHDVSKKDLQNLYNEPFSGHVHERIICSTPASRISSSDVLYSDIIYADITRHSLTGSQMFIFNIYHISGTAHSKIRSKHSLMSAILMSKFFHHTDNILQLGFQQPQFSWHIIFLVEQIAFNHLSHSFSFSLGLLEGIGDLVQRFGQLMRSCLWSLSWGFLVERASSFKMAQEISIGITNVIAVYQFLPLVSIIMPKLSSRLRTARLALSIVIGMVVGEIMALDGFLGPYYCRVLRSALLHMLQFRVGNSLLCGIPQEVSGYNMTYMLLGMDFLLSYFMIGLGLGMESVGWTHGDVLYGIWIVDRFIGLFHTLFGYLKLFIVLFYLSNPILKYLAT